MNNKIINVDQALSPLDDQINELHLKSKNAKESIDETSSDIKELQQLLYGVPDFISTSPEDPTVPELDILNITINDLSSNTLPGDISLSSLDVVVSIIAGIVATIIDIVFVGTPEVVKLYKKGENFDGSILTKLLRKIGSGNDKLSDMFKWLSEKCKVPYDISAMKDVVTPDNHRLRNFAHDPMFGLLFAVADIILGTATLVDNNGRIRIIVNGKSTSPIKKYLAVIYYLGHLLSDVCTARGLPIPGFFLTQFFSGDNNSIAQIAESMYKDGYDIRHLASMTTPVFIKNLILDGYLFLSKTDMNNQVSIAMSEITKNKKIAYKHKLRLVSDAVCCSGNVLKFFIPPTAGNMTALNLPEWISLLKDTIITLKYQYREKSVEEIIGNREIINDNRQKLYLS